MTSTPLLIGPATVFTNAPDALVRSHAGVLCADGRVRDVGDWKELLDRNPTAQRLDARGGVVLPGLINAHHHLYSTFAKGMPIPAGTPLHDFPSVLEGIWWRLDRALDLASIEAGALPPLMDCLRWGTTTLIDHHASPSAIRGSLEALERACDQLGVRACLCYEVTDRNGAKGANDGIDENAAFSARCEKGSRHAALLGLHASFTVSDETLARAAEQVRVPIHVHVAEDIADVKRTHEQFHRGIIDRLEAFGLLRPNSLLVHGVHLEQADLARVAAANAWIVHNPESNANNAVGTFDSLRALDAGVRVALGTDGMASNMLRAAKSAYLMLRALRRDPTVGMDLPRRLLFDGNVRLARALFGDPLLGALVPGAPADVCVVDYDPATPLDEGNFDGHFVFGVTESPVLATVIGGQVRMLDGTLIGVDREAMRRRIASAARGVWDRLS